MRRAASASSLSAIWPDKALGEQSVLDTVGDGSLPEDAFNRWLVQDYLSVRGFAGFASLTVEKTPRLRQSVLIAGLLARDDELDWFETHAEARSLDPRAELYPECQYSVDFLITVGYSEQFQVLLALFYGVEVAYAVTWGRLEVRGLCAEVIDRWPHEDFQAYVRVLSTLVDEHPHPGQRTMFNEVVCYEREFWRMIWKG